MLLCQFTILAPLGAARCPRWLWYGMRRFALKAVLLFAFKLVVKAMWRAFIRRPGNAEFLWNVRDIFAVIGVAVVLLIVASVIVLILKGCAQ